MYIYMVKIQNTAGNHIILESILKHINRQNQIKMHEEVNTYKS